MRLIEKDSSILLQLKMQRYQITKSPSSSRIARPPFLSRGWSNSSPRPGRTTLVEQPPSCLEANRSRTTLSFVESRWRQINPRFSHHFRPTRAKQPLTLYPRNVSKKKKKKKIEVEKRSIFVTPYLCLTDC